ncbi:phenylalanine--tRNA ligase subunit beta [Mycoplasma sp. 4044]
MLFSFLELKRLANLDESITIEEVAKAINSIGFEVEEYWRFTDVEGIKFGHVLKTYPNPNSDRLTVCEIEFNDKIRTIQTNATNVKEGHYLMAFVPGSRSKKDVFQAREMRSIISEGMLVGLEEIGFKPDSISEKNMWNDGIFVFENKVDLNLDPIEYFALDDYIIDISILSNRADANSYLIMAKELAAYFGTTPLSLNKLLTKEFHSDFSIKSLQETNHFTLREIKVEDIKISLQDELFLMKNEIKSISKAVDLSNLVLLYAGLPTHAYDVRKLNSKDFEVKKYTGQAVVFGNKEVELDQSLCVLNNNKVVSVAAVIGCENSGCDSQTTSALFEIASFDLKEVRNSKKQVKIETNSANRASKEISMGSILLAHEYLESKVKQASQIIGYEDAEQHTFDYDAAYLDFYAGFEITATDKFKQTLQKLNTLGIEIKDEKVMAPAYRYDLKTMQDLTEEVFRFYGYENFAIIQPEIKQVENVTYKDYNNILKAMKYQNVRTFTLTSAKANILNPFDFNSTIDLATYVSSDRNQLRHSLALSLAEVLDYNQKRSIKKMSIFEIGMIQDKSNVLGLASNEKSFNEMKQDIVDLLDCQVEFIKQENKYLHPNYSALIFKNGKMIGYLGKLNPQVYQSEAIYAEIFLDEDKAKAPIFANYKHDPLKTRDFTINLQNHESVQTVLDKIAKLKGIYQVSVIDKYQKDDGSVNVTFSFLVEDWAIKKLESVLG